MMIDTSQTLQRPSTNKRGSIRSENNCCRPSLKKQTNHQFYYYYFNDVHFYPAPLLSGVSAHFNSIFMMHCAGPRSELCFLIFEFILLYSSTAALM